VLSAIKDVNNNTKVKLVPLPEGQSERSYIYFSINEGGGNWCDAIGFVNRGIKVHYSNGGYRILHELLHALGFIHEQQRNDRDTFLEIDQEHMDAGSRDWTRNNILDTTRDSVHLTPYDINSAMHYWCSAGGEKVPWYKVLFTRNFNGEYITMIYKPNRDLKFDTPERLSKLDIEGINKFYENCQN